MEQQHRENRVGPDHATFASDMLRPALAIQAGMKVIMAATMSQKHRLWPSSVQLRSVTCRLIAGPLTGTRDFVR
jgi:hypothetical protein